MSSAIWRSGTSCVRIATKLKRYEALKRDVVRRRPQDRLAYIEGKDQYVNALEARAARWARKH
jgi:hypothetical protein